MNLDKLYYLENDSIYAELKAFVSKSLQGKPYPMTLRSQDEWTALATAVNIGIDAHLEALTRSKFDARTGECSVHPEELPILVRRLMDGDDEAQQLGYDIVSTLEEE